MKSANLGTVGADDAAGVVDGRAGDHVQARDSGFTLVELMVTLALLGLMAAISIGGWRSWAVASEHTGTAREIQSLLRRAHQRAVTEGRATCVQFDAAGSSWTLFRGACDDPARLRLEGPVTADSREVQVASPAFTGPAGTSTGVTFYARGTAWPGEVRVTRTGTSKTYVLKVEGLTGRVSLS